MKISFRTFKISFFLFVIAGSVCIIKSHVSCTCIIHIIPFQITVEVLADLFSRFSLSIFFKLFFFWIHLFVFCISSFPLYLAFSGDCRRRNFDDRKCRRHPRKVGSWFLIIVSVFLYFTYQESFSRSCKSAVLAVIRKKYYFLVSIVHVARWRWLEGYSCLENLLPRRSTEICLDIVAKLGTRDSFLL